MMLSRVAIAAFCALVCAMPQGAGAQTTTTTTDGYIMGAGRWPCDEVLRVAQSGTDIEQGQLIGWVLAFWSAATLTRETGFVDTVEGVGGQRIYTATLEECQKAPGSLLLYRLSREMIRNTK